MDNLEESKSRFILNEYGVANVNATDYPGGFNCEEPWSHSKFEKKFSIEIVRYNKTEMEFDLIGVHAAIANAFRRVLLSEVPSMAIEKVKIFNNTSLIQDEVLAHRLGLIPLRADPRMFEYKADPTADPTEQDTLEFELKIKCKWNSSSHKDATHPDDLYRNHNVYSKHLKWMPIGGQADIFKPDQVGPVFEDILINKMRPGHEMDLRLLAVKGLGKDHAKFSPVATASYRLLPEITLTKDVEGEMAERLQKCFSPGVIDVEDNGHGRKKAKVKDARYDSCSRNVFRYDDLKDSVKMARVKDHYIFTIESVGALPPDVLFIEALKVLKKKCTYFLDELNENSNNK
ncbi:DNA-directed RNA polymerases I and III subunit RPAC1 [Frankliniella occidentalis]|uniref:DNA-directed RNA polymerases I and III subunit RPAC1 n=1 Tax=Frankliniella occidentalis TaxID=133901 RepID=A0A6J1RXW0_FRAOC|nr:DNA-directed RNA polymerases I and III subunit RPAC1 [Frankliniella occidentalis]